MRRRIGFSMKLRQADRIATALEEMVLTGQFQDGQRLDELRLARMFDVSRTPVREALQRLVDADLARQMPRRGVFVRQPNSIRLIEMFETMAEIEGVCCRLAARRIDSKALSQLADLNKHCRDALDDKNADLYSQHNEDFHRLIYQLTGNAFLETQAFRLYSLLRPFRRVQFLMPGRMSQSVSEHDAMIEAMAASSTASAEQLARDHVASQGERFHNQMAKLKRTPTFRIAS